MSSMSPITTSSAPSVGPLARAASAASVARVNIRSFMSRAPRVAVASDAQVLVQQCHFVLKLAGCEIRHHPPALHDVEAVGERGGEAEILLAHDDGVALFAQLLDGAPECLHDDRREALGDLIEQQ